MVAVHLAHFSENDPVLARVERFRLEDRKHLLSTLAAVVVQQESAKHALLCFNAVRRCHEIRGHHRPLARFGVDIDVQEVFQRLAAPSFPGALIRAILKHPAAVTGDVAQVRLPVGHGKAVAIKLTGNFVGFLPERADQVAAFISKDPDALRFR